MKSVYKNVQIGLIRIEKRESVFIKSTSDRQCMIYYCQQYGKRIYKVYRNKNVYMNGFYVTAFPYQFISL